MLQADFLDAHERHWDDAERLRDAGRFANADHLYGIAAECGMKRLMLAWGMPCDATTGRPTKRQDRAHAKLIWKQFESYRSGHAQGAGYALPANNPFDNWDVSDRYAHQSNFNQEWVQKHRQGAQIIRRLIKKAQLGGLLP